MAFVIQRKSDGRFAKGRGGRLGWTEWLSDAAIYPRKCDAKNSGHWIYKRDEVLVREVDVSLVEEA